MTGRASGPLRVLIVTPQGRGGAGGIDRVMDQLRMADEGRIDVQLLFAISRGSSHLNSLGHLPRTALLILWKGLRGEIDVVHLNLASNASTYRKVLLSWVCRLVGVPYVIHLHGALFHKFWAGLGGWRQRRVDGFFRQAGASIVLGEVWREVLLAHVPELGSRIHVVPNASGRRQPARGNGTRPHILFLGQLGQRKGVPDLVEALARLPTDRAWTATIAGNGEVEAVRERVAALGLTERVAVPGWVGGADVDQLLDQADILILPSYDENLPMSVIEAMAAGLAVIATPVGATADIIRHGETGLLVTPGNVEEQAKALERLIGDAALRRQLGEAARRFHADALDAATYLDRLLPAWRVAAGWDARVLTTKKQLAGSTIPDLQ